MSSNIKRTQINHYIDFLKKRIAGKPAAIPNQHHKVVVPDEKVAFYYRKILRGLRRRRNWLMRTGQWPPARPVSFNDIADPKAFKNPAVNWALKKEQ